MTMQFNRALFLLTTMITAGVAESRGQALIANIPFSEPRMPASPCFC